MNECLFSLIIHLFTVFGLQWLLYGSKWCLIKLLPHSDASLFSYVTGTIPWGMSAGGGSGWKDTWSQDFWIFLVVYFFDVRNSLSAFLNGFILPTLVSRGSWLYSFPILEYVCLLMYSCLQRGIFTISASVVLVVFFVGVNRLSRLLHLNFLLVFTSSNAM